MIEELRKKLRALLEERAGKQRTMSFTLAKAEGRADGTLSADEEREFNEARSAIQAIDAKRAELEARIAELELDAAEARSAAGQLGALPPAGRGHAPARVNSEARTYEPGGEHDFLVDAFRSTYLGDVQAGQRIQRNRQEFDAEHRATNTSAYGSLVVPQFLTELFAPVVRGGRPFLNSVRELPLPDEGEVLTIPRGTTGTTVDVQVTQNDEVSNTDYDETDLEVRVRTFAGQQDVARQSLERGRGVAEITFADLTEDYAFKVNRSAIIGNGLLSQHLGVLNTPGIGAFTYTTSAPTYAGVYAKLAEAVGGIAGTRFRPPTVAFMSPRRWAWFCAQLDNSGRPIVSQGQITNAVAVGHAGEYGQIVGTLPGLNLPVVTDASIPVTLGAGTNEDVIIVAKADDILFMESDGAPQELRFEETAAGKLQVKLVVYGYSAFTAGRYPSSIATIRGTGLVTPTF